MKTVKRSTAKAGTNGRTPSAPEFHNFKVKLPDGSQKVAVVTDAGLPGIKRAARQKRISIEKYLSNDQAELARLMDERKACWSPTLDEISERIERPKQFIEWLQSMPDYGNPHKVTAPGQLTIHLALVDWVRLEAVARRDGKTLSEIAADALRQGIDKLDGCDNP